MSRFGVCVCVLRPVGGAAPEAHPVSAAPPKAAGPGPQLPEGTGVEGEDREPRPRRQAHLSREFSFAKDGCN